MKKKMLIFLALLIPVFILTGCSSSWLPSDKEAVKLVQDHFLFYNEGEVVKAEVVGRGDYNEKFECYPVQFKIVYSSGRDNHKTFYLYKDDNGNPAIRKFLSY